MNINRTLGDANYSQRTFLHNERAASRAVQYDNPAMKDSAVWRYVISHFQR